MRFNMMRSTTPSPSELLWRAAAQPFKQMVIESSREKIRRRGLEIGSDVEAEVEYFNNDSVRSELQQIQKNIENDSIIYPEYYRCAFHGYDLGNLDWLPAFEYKAVSESVFSDVYSKSKLSRFSNYRLRDNAQRAIKRYVESRNIIPEVIVDMGCAVGLSTIPLARSFPQAKIIGIDLSSYFISTAIYNLNHLSELSEFKNQVSYKHASAECSNISTSSVDVVSYSLMEHELPNAIAYSVIQEAYRILRPGGVIAFMDMDPESIYIKRFNENWFAKTAFAVTEPWFQEFCRFPLKEALLTIGFANIVNVKTSPKHRVIIAQKLP